MAVAIDDEATLTPAWLGLSENCMSAGGDEGVSEKHEALLTMCLFFIGAMFEVLIFLYLDGK